MGAKFKPFFDFSNFSDFPDLSVAFAAIVSLPSVLCFAVGVIGMVLMGVFAAKLDSADVRSNWIEQLTNAAAQAAILVGILLLF